MSSSPSDFSSKVVGLIGFRIVELMCGDFRKSHEALKFLLNRSLECMQQSPPYVKGNEREEGLSIGVVRTSDIFKCCRVLCDDLSSLAFNRAPSNQRLVQDHGTKL